MIVRNTQLEKLTEEPGTFRDTEREASQQMTQLEQMQRQMMQIDDDDEYDESQKQMDTEVP